MPSRSRAAHRLAAAAAHLAPTLAATSASVEADTETTASHSSTAGSVGHVATELTAGLRLLDKGGQADLCAGFFSARHPADPGLFLAPSHGTFWKEATPSIYGVYSAENRERVDGGNGPLPNFPSTAVSAAIYSSFPEIGAIIHAHPASIMAVSAADAEAGTILPISEPSFMFYERVASLPCNFFFDDDYIETIVAALRGGAYCIMMRNHSYIMTGKDVQECYMRAYMVEQSATVQLKMLAATGGVIPKIPDHEECLFHRRSYEGYDGCPPYDGQLEWPAFVRSIDADCPGWRGAGEGAATLALS